MKLRFLCLMADTLLSDLLSPYIIIIIITLCIKAGSYQALNHNRTYFCIICINSFYCFSHPLEI